MSYDHNKIKLEQKDTWKNPKMFKSKYISNNSRIKEETRRYLEVSLN